MESMLIAIRIGVIAVLVVAAVGKLRDRESTRRAAADLGVPSPWARPVARALPLVEATLAALLVFSATTQAASAAAAVLFATFTVLVAATLARGRAPECNCFGSLSSAPISGWTVVRNLGLLGAAVATTSRAGPSLWDADPVITFGALVAVETAVLAVLATRGRRRGDDTIPSTPGSRAPSFTLSSADGNTVSLDDALAADRPALLVFTSPNCVACAELLPDIARWQRSHAEQLSVIPISSGPADANRAKAAAAGIELLLDPDGDVATAYGSPGTPSAVLVEPDGTIAGAIVAGPGPVRRLVMEALARNNGSDEDAHDLPSTETSIGDPAPPFTLDTLHHHPVSLSDYSGHLVLLVFWDTTCGYCLAFLPELRRWEAERDEGVHVLLVATGTPEALAAQGWRSHVALDPGSVVARSFGASGTPMAVLVDAAGRVASDIAVGADDVLALGRRAESLARLAATFSPT